MYKQEEHLSPTEHVQEGEAVVKSADLTYGLANRRPGLTGHKTSNLLSQIPL